VFCAVIDRSSYLSRPKFCAWVYSTTCTEFGFPAWMYLSAITYVLMTRISCPCIMLVLSGIWFHVLWIRFKFREQVCNKWNLYLKEPGYSGKLSWAENIYSPDYQNIKTPIKRSLPATEKRPVPCDFVIGSSQWNRISTWDCVANRRIVVRFSLVFSSVCCIKFYLFYDFCIDGYLTFSNVVTGMYYSQILVFFFYF
jgi:hypothetical protein